MTGGEAGGEGTGRNLLDSPVDIGEHVPRQSEPEVESYSVDRQQRALPSDAGE